MIIVYEIKSLLHKTYNVNESVCPSCSQKGGLQLHICQRYVSWFIPMMPSFKYGELECTHCSAIHRKRHWPAEIKSLYKTEKRKISTPFRLWSGMLALIGLLGVLIPFSIIEFVDKDSW